MTLGMEDNLEQSTSYMDPVVSWGNAPMAVLMRAMSIVGPMTRDVPEYFNNVFIGQKWWYVKAVSMFVSTLV